MKISRELAIKILKYLDEHKQFYFPFQIMSRDYLGESGEFLEIEPREWKIVLENERFKNFEIWENLQNLYPETLELMSKGFLEKITGESLERHIATLAKNYRKEWKEELWESEDIEEFGLNEFIGGKAEGYEESLEIVRKYRHNFLES
jgi:hypothetical protein